MPTLKTLVPDGAALISVLADFDPAPTGYFKHGADRIAAALNMIPKGSGSVLEIGCDSHFTLAMSQLTDYTVLPQNSPTPLAAAEDVTDPVVRFTHRSGSVVAFERLLFDAERDPFPFADQSMQGVLFCEVLEHLFYDPAWVLHEANRVLVPGGWLLLTTPNLTSYHALRRLAQGNHPFEHSMYFHGGRYPRLPIQHTREYACWEVVALLEASGFSIERLETNVFMKGERLGWREWLTLLPATMLYNVLNARHPRHLDPRYRRPHTSVLARRAHQPRERFPKNIYLQ